MEFFVKPGEDEEWHQYWIDERTRWYIDLGINPDNLRHYEHPQEKLQPLLQAHRRHRVPLQLRRLGVGRARGHRQPHRLRPHDARQALRPGPVLLRPGRRRALHALRHRAGGRPVAQPDDLPGRRLHRGRGAQHQGRRRQAHRAAARPAPRAGQGRGAAAVRNADLSPKAKDLAAELRQQLERRLRRRRRDRPPLPPPGRDRHAVLRHRRLRHPRGQRGDRPRARHDGAGAGAASTASAPTSPSDSSAADAVPATIGRMSECRPRLASLGPVARRPDDGAAGAGRLRSDSAATSRRAPRRHRPAAESPAATASPTASSTVAVPDGVAADRPGHASWRSATPATVAYEPTPGRGHACSQLTVNERPQGQLADFKGCQPRRRATSRRRPTTTSR